jgi:DNA-directed RNA polymerase subunit RPC12/RpoP
MGVYEALTVILIAMLALAATVAIYIGLIGLLGGLYIVECSQCGHLTFSSTNRPGPSCVHCRHPVLMHPVHAIVHADR